MVVGLPYAVKYKSNEAKFPKNEIKLNVNETTVALSFLFGQLRGVLIV